MLSAEQAQFFARNGFVQLPGVIPAATCAHLVERTWARLPPHWRRDDPRTWRGMVRDSCHLTGLDRGGLLKFQDKELGVDPLVVATWQPRSPVHALAHALIGRPLQGIRVRGLYAIAPAEHPERLPVATSPHVEAHPAQIVAVNYLDDVAPGGGGLLVWPGSHRALYPAFGSKLEYVAPPDLAARIAAITQYEPVELHGRRGDVVLTHHRLLHSPSLNRRDRIRFAFLCDYTAQEQLALCRQPPGDDLWEDWPGLVQLAGKDGCAGEPDYPRRAAQAPRARRWFAWPWRRAAAPLSVASPSSRNKHDASMLARQRQPGDVWLSLSDSPAWFDKNSSLDPKGGELATRGVEVLLNGAPLQSRSRGDITVLLQPRAGTNELTVRGIPGPLWLRVLALRLPFATSDVLLRQQLAGDQREVRLQFAWTPTAATGVALESARE